MEELKLNLKGVFGQDIIGAAVAKQIDDYKGDKIFATINSVGGAIDNAFDVYNALQRFGGEKVCLIEGNCASAATFVMLAFDEIQARFASSIMIHTPLAMGVQGNAEELAKYSAQLKSYEDTFVALYAARMKKTDAEVRELLKNESTFNAMTALNVGLIDKVIDAPKIEMIFNFAKRVFGLAKMQGEINSLAKRQDFNNENKDIKMAEYAKLEDAFADIEAFIGKIEDETLKAEIQGIFDGLKGLVKPEEEPEEKPDVEIEEKIDAAVKAVQAKVEASFEAKFAAYKKEQAKLFAQGGFITGGAAKSHTEVYSALKSEGKDEEARKYLAEHKAAIYAGK